MQAKKYRLALYFIFLSLCSEVTLCPPVAYTSQTKHFIFQATFGHEQIDVKINAKTIHFKSKSYNDLFARKKCLDPALEYIFQRIYRVEKEEIKRLADPQVEDRSPFIAYQINNHQNYWVHGNSEFGQLIQTLPRQFAELRVQEELVCKK